MKHRIVAFAFVLAVGLTSLECKRPERESHLAVPSPAQMRIVRVEVGGDGAVIIEGRECPWTQMVDRLRAIPDQEHAILYLRGTEKGADVSGYITSIVEASAEAGWSRYSVGSQR